MKRIQRSRRHKQPPNTKYVGRPTEWGNPFKVIEDTMYKGQYRLVLRDTSPHLIDILVSFPFSYPDKWSAQAAAVECYQELHGIHPSQPPSNRGNLFAERVRLSLSGYDHLSCWCEEGTPCHADVLVALVEQGPKDFYR